MPRPKKPRLRKAAPRRASPAPSQKAAAPTLTAPADAAAEPRAAPERHILAPDDRVLASTLALHELFAQQTARMLDRADLSEEQKQNILIGMSCPCCGAGGFSFTAKLRRG